MGRDERIYQEAAELWRQLYSEPPPAQADGASMLDWIICKLADPEYDRLSTPHLRPTNITFPKN